MKKWAVIFVGLFLALALTGVCFAQEKAKPAKPEAAKPEAAKPEAPKPEAAKPEAPKPEVAKKEAPAKPAMVRMGGIVTAMDLATKKMTLQQNQVKKQKKVTLKVGAKAQKNLAGVNVGDAVNVVITGNTITSLTKIF
jgi:hypothetical protein